MNHFHRDFDSAVFVDLYLGSDIGLWVLGQIDPSQVGCVITLDNEIASIAAGMGVKVLTGDANSIDFTASRTGLSIHYPRIIRQPLIEGYHRLYNLHPGYLPWGRGFYPVFWALWNRTPAGATLHEITAGVDEGPIVAQIRVEYSDDDTGGSLHERVRKAEEQLFLDFWPRIVSGDQLEAIPQNSHFGSTHTRKEFHDLKQQAKWEEMSSVELMRLIRCFTFHGYSGFEISLGEKRFAMTLQLINDRPR